MFGREPRTFISMSLPEVNDGQTPDVRAQIAEVVQRLHFAHEDARKNLEKQAMKTYYDKDCRTHEYAVGVLPTYSVQRAKEVLQRIFWTVYHY